MTKRRQVLSFLDLTTLVLLLLLVVIDTGITEAASTFRPSKLALTTSTVSSSSLSSEPIPQQQDDEDVVLGRHTGLHGRTSVLLLREQQQHHHHHDMGHDSMTVTTPTLSSHLDVSSLSTSMRGGATAVATVAAAAPKQSEFTAALLQNLLIGFYFFLWYALNVIYNILNKKLLNILPAPVTVGTLQLGIGGLYAYTLWLTGIRKRPVLTPKGKKAVNLVGFWHAAGQEASMVSLGAGPVSFTHIVKALEPFFSAIVSAFYLGKWMKPAVYATLLPVVGGVGYACLKERSFSWLAFYMAMASNLAFALRAVLSKEAMSGKDGEIGTNLTPPNTFAAVTISSFLLSIPMAFLYEGFSFVKLWNDALEKTPVVDLVKAIVVSGLFHYLNNEVMYLALGSVHPVTLAVGNTMKRVFILVASVMVFRNEITPQAAVGSTIGIAGVLLYSLTKQHYEKLEAAEAAAATSSANKKEMKEKTSPKPEPAPKAEKANTKAKSSSGKDSKR